MSIFDELEPPPKSSKVSLKNPKIGRQFATILNGFALAYHLLHKFIMPLIVIYTTSLPTQSLEKLDWWWLYHAVLAYLLVRKKWESDFMRFWVAFGFGGALIQIFESLSGKTWHSFSLWLTAATTFVVVLFVQKLLQKTSFKKAVLYFSLGLVCGFLTEGSLYYFYNRKPYEIPKNPQANFKKVARLLSDENECGVMSFSLRAKNESFVVPNLKSLNVVKIKDCGLPYPLVKVENSKIIFENTSLSYVNLKFSSWDVDGWRGFRNIPMPQNARKEILLPKENHVILVSSDAKPEIGILLLIQEETYFFEKIKSFQSIEKRADLLIFNRETIQAF